MREGGYFDLAIEANAIMHTWSLAVEEQFYLVWAPALYMLGFGFGKIQSSFKQSGGYWLVIFVGIFCLGLTIDYVTCKLFTSKVAFFSPLSRSWELALGAVGAGLFRHFGGWWKNISPIKLGILILLCYGLLIASLILIDEKASQSPHGRAIPCAVTLVLLCCPHGSRRNLIAKFFSYIGDISYSLYLWHWPIICFSPFILNTSNEMITRLFSVVSFSILSVASYHGIERRFLYNENWNILWSKQSVMVAIMLMILAGGGFALKTESDSSWRFPSAVSIEERWTYPVPRGFPEYGDLAIPFSMIKEAQVVLIGDSHARHIDPLVSSWCGDYGYKLANFSRNGFNPFLCGGVTSKVNEPGDTGISAKLYQVLLDSDVRFVFIAQRTVSNLQSESFSASYEPLVNGFVAGLVEKNIHVVLLGQPNELPREPKPGPSLADLLLRRDWKEKDLCPTAEIIEIQMRESSAYDRLAKSEYVSHLVTKEILQGIFDEKDRCLYDDYNHLNYYGAMALKDELSKLLQPYHFRIGKSRGKR